MENKDKTAFYTALKKMALLTNGSYSLPDDIAKSYWEALKGFEVAKVIKALNDVGLTEEGHQPPGKLARLISGKAKTGAQAEWSNLNALLLAKGVSGAREVVDIETKGFKILARIGGFRALNASGPDLAAVKSRFFAEYDK